MRTWMGCAVLLAACASGGGAGSFSPGGHFGSDGGTTTTDGGGAASLFAGTWTYLAGSSALVSCGGSSTQSAVTGTDTIAKVDAARVTLTTQGGTCKLPFAVMGTVARLAGSPVCARSTVQNGQTITLTSMFTSGTLSTIDGKSLGLELRSTVVTQGSGTSTTCSSTVQGSLTRKQ